MQSDLLVPDAWRHPAGHLQPFGRHFPEPHWPR